MNQPTQNQRYLRQLRLPFWDQATQDRLSETHVMLIGCGALGCPSIDLIARAGVGKITLIDRDFVDISNLHRQTLFTNNDAINQVPKAQAAKSRISEINPEIEVDAHIVDFNAFDSEYILLDSRFGKPDVLLDGTDNFETRFLINDLSVKHQVPYVYGGAIGSKGMAAVFIPGSTPCLRCVFDAPPPTGSQPTCESAGVFSPVSSIIGSYQASETLKILMGENERVMKTMLEFDLWEGQRRRIDLSQMHDPSCPCCVQNQFDYIDREDDEYQLICGRKAIQINPQNKAPIDFDSLEQILSTHGQFERHTYMLKGELSVSGTVLSIFSDGRAIFEGIDDPALARSMYARYIGS